MTQDPAFLSACAEALRIAGFEFCQAFAIDDAAAELFPFRRFDKPSTLGLLVANERAVWRPFTVWHKGHPSTPNPFQSYVESSVAEANGAATQLTSPTPRTSIYYSHRLDYATSPDGSERGAVPFQRLAAFAGLAALGPAHLNAHPRVGPWLSLRAVIATDITYVQPPSTARQPCASCAAPCQAALERALQVGLPPTTREGFAHWLAVRTVCPIGRKYRFEPEMTRYHYLSGPLAGSV